MAAAHAQTAMQVDLTFVRSLDTIVCGNVEKQLFIEDVQLRTKKCANPDHENMPLFSLCQLKRLISLLAARSFRCSFCHFPSRPWHSF